MPGRFAKKSEVEYEGLGGLEKGLLEVGCREAAEGAKEKWKVETNRDAHNFARESREYRK